MESREFDSVVLPNGATISSGTTLVARDHIKLDPVDSVEYHTDDIAVPPGGEVTIESIEKAKDDESGTLRINLSSDSIPHFMLYLGDGEGYKFAGLVQRGRLIIVNGEGGCE